MTDGPETAYHLPNPANADSRFSQKRSKFGEIGGRARNQSLEIEDDAPESISEFSDDSLPRLFGANSRASTLDEKDEEGLPRGEQEVPRRVLPPEFNEAKREESPFFGREGGGERGFDVWRDQY